MEPLDASGLPAWRQVAVAAILAGLAGALIWQVSRDPEPLSPSSTVAVIPAASPSLPSIPGAAPIPATPSEVTVRPTSVPSIPASVVASTTTLIESEVLDSAQQALDAWGRFAVTGDLALLDPWFDVDGPQYVRLVTEAEALRESPLGDPAYKVGLSSAAVTADPEGRAVVEGSVTFSRPGEAPQSFAWRIVFTRTDEGWALWSVQPV